MKEQFKRYVERIDNATLRERVLMFGAAAVALIYVANVLVIQPLRDTQRRLGREVEQNVRELNTVQTALQQLARDRQADPEAQHRQRAVALRSEIAALDARIQQEQRRFTTPQRMREVLREMFERDKRLRLVDLKTLPVTDLAAGQSGRRVFRHGIELTVAGSYLDLYAYLAALEQIPTQLYWGRIEMSVASYPVATLKMTVYTLSFEQAWMVV